MVTTVASSIAMPLPSTVARSTHRPCRSAVRSRAGSEAAAAVSATLALERQEHLVEELHVLREVPVAEERVAHPLAGRVAEPVGELGVAQHPAQQACEAGEVARVLEQQAV